MFEPSLLMYLNKFTDLLLHSTTKQMNVPRAKSTSSDATATADPLEEPPGTNDRIWGLIGVP